MAVFTTINDPGSFYNTILYTGTGSSNAITGVGFQPDFVWIKNRDGTYWHNLYDAVRGTNQSLASNDTAADTTRVNFFNSFDSDGFTVASTDQNVNTSTVDYVSWNWKAGTTTGIAGSPSITPDGYSFNATSGFSIIEYTGNTTSGATIPHGLGVAPKMVLFKNMSTTDAWAVYHETMGNDRYLVLNTPAIESVNSNRFNDTSPTSTLITLGNSANTNGSGNSLIAYCFADVPCYSHMGTYTGNADADGPFCYCGFRPAYILVKIYNYGDPKNWPILNSKMTGYNLDNDALYANTTAATDTQDTIDFVSNGFKLRRADDTLNAVPLKYVYAAFAEAPLVNAEGVPVNAR